MALKKRQEVLCQALGESTSCHDKLTVCNIQMSKYYCEILAVYKNLGGILKDVPCNLKKGDIELPKMIVELDEEQHFNRYREVTLESPIYDKLKRFPISEYRSYCEQYEDKCRTDGKFWTNKSCEIQFGSAGDRGVLDTNGAPRWKQRAFYDFLKDISILIIGTQYVRLSIYDAVKYLGVVRTVDYVLRNPEREGIEALREKIKSRTY